MGIHVRRKDKSNLPEAFRVEQDIERGLFIDQNGERLTEDAMRHELAKPGNKILRVRFFVRYRKDPPDAPLRTKTAIAILGGKLTPNELRRAIYKLAREQYGGKEKKNG
jgi:hypothetical protein